MKEHKLIKTFHMFGKLNISAMIPEVTQGEWCVLKAIERSNNDKAVDNVKISELADKLELAPPSVSRTLKSLEQKGFVKRVVDNEDRRNTYAELTKEGERLLDRIENIMEDFVQTVTGQMGEDELEKLNEYFMKLYYIAKKELESRKINARRDDK